MNQKSAQGIEINQHHLNALRVGTPLVAEVQASCPDRRAWVSIYPQEEDLDREARAEGWKRSVAGRKFNVHHLEFSVAHMEHGWDIAIGDGMWHLTSASVTGEEELLSLLHAWAMPLDALNYPWATDYPL